jgi:exopolysaccharide biosynthesis WecB/TagA/CpsF family protein
LSEIDRPVDELLALWKHGGVTVTWLNHFTVQHADPEALRRIRAIGIDGTLLQLLIGRTAPARTSADLLLPELLERNETARSRIAVVGGAPGRADAAAARLGERVVFTADGYDDLASLRRDPGPLVASAPDIVLLGLGAGLQDVVALEVAAVLPAAAVFTVGGWLDQLAMAESYFPAWVHALRLGWAWRLAHEPRRLLRRYTVDAVRAVRRRKRIRVQILELTHPGARFLQGRAG